MSSRHHTLLPIALVFLSASAPLSAQRVEAPVVTPTPLSSPENLRPRWQTRPLNRPELLGAGTLSASLATTVGLVGGATGLLLGYRNCTEREKDFMLAGLTCLFYNKGLLYGTYTGTFAGAALGAGSGAIRAGCSANGVWKRSFLGSLVGTLPALSYLAAGGSGSDDVQNGFLIGTPILQIVGATAAVSRCRLPERRYPGRNAP